MLGISIKIFSGIFNHLTFKSIWVFFMPLRVVIPIFIAKWSKAFFYIDLARKRMRSHRMTDEQAERQSDRHTLLSIIHF